MLGDLGCWIFGRKLERMESLEGLKDHDSDSIFFKALIASTKIAHMNEGIEDMEDVLVGTQPG